MILKDQIIIQVANDINADTLVVEMIVDKILFYEFTNNRGQISVKLYSISNHKPVEMDGQLFLNAIAESLRTAQTLEGSTPT